MASDAISRKTATIRAVFTVSSNRGSVFTGPVVRVAALSVSTSGARPSGNGEGEQGDDGDGEFFHVLILFFGVISYEFGGRTGCLYCLRTHLFPKKIDN